MKGRFAVFVGSKTPAVQGLIAGLIFGLPMGLYALWATRSLLSSALSVVIGGVFVGAAIALVVSRRGGLRSGISAAEKRTVVGSVFTGRAAEDPHLAGAIIDYAEAVRRPQPLERQGRWMFRFFLVLSAILALSQFASAHILPGLGWLAAVAFWIVFPRRAAGVRQRQLDRARAAEDQARRSVEGQ